MNLGGRPGGHRDGARQPDEQGRAASGHADRRRLLHAEFRGGTKTLQQWAEGILRFFEGQRPGAKRGRRSRRRSWRPSTSRPNIDAWFRTNQVEEYMQDAFWQYAHDEGRLPGSSPGQRGVRHDVRRPSGGKRGSRKTTTSPWSDLGFSNKARRDFTLASRRTSSAVGRCTSTTLPGSVPTLVPDLPQPFPRLDAWADCWSLSVRRWTRSPRPSPTCFCITHAHRPVGRA